MSENTTHTMTITPKFINPPKEGKTNYSVKDTDDFLYSLNPQYLESFNIGVPVEVTYENREFNGNWFKMVKGARPPQAQSQPAPGPAPRPAGSVFSQDKHIFITGVTGRAMGSGNFAAVDIKDIALAAAAAFDALINRETPSQDINDEIPF